MNAVPNEIIINTLDGNSFTFLLETEESFQNVVEAIKQHENATSEPQIFMTIAANQITASTAPYVKGKPRDFWTPLTPAEKEDISYILRTLANQTLLKINSNKSTLNKAGDRIEHIHPLRFLTYVFSNDELIVCMRNLQGRAWVWSEFLEGVINSLKDEQAIGNIKDDYVQELTSQSHTKDPSAIFTHVKNQSWGTLISTLISDVPRQKDGNRYDM